MKESSWDVAEEYDWPGEKAAESVESKEYVYSRVDICLLYIKLMKYE